MIVWRVEHDPATRVLTVRIRGRVERPELLELAAAHARALEATGGQPFVVFMDLTGLFPLDAEGVTLLGAIKRVAADCPGMRRLGVLVDSATVALQQLRARVSDGATGRELVTQKPEELRRWLA